MFSVTTRHCSGTTGLAVAGPRRVAKSNKGHRAVFLAIGIGPVAVAAVWSGAPAAQLAAASPAATMTVAAVATGDPGQPSGDDNSRFGVSVLRGSSPAVGGAGATAGPDKHSSGNSDAFGVTVMRGAMSPPEAPYPCSSGDGVDRGFGCMPPAEPYSAYQPREDLGSWPDEGYGSWDYGWPYYGSAAFSHRASRREFLHGRRIVAPRFAFRQHPRFSFARESGGLRRHGRR